MRSDLPPGEPGPSDQQVPASADAVWAGRIEFIRRVLSRRKYSLAPDEVENVLSEVCDVLRRYLEKRTPYNERGLITRMCDCQANTFLERRSRERKRTRSIEDPEIKSRIHHEEDPESSEESSASERLLNLLTPLEVRFFFLEFFRRHKADCLEHARVYFERRGFVDLARERGVKDNTVVKQWERCREKVEVFVMRHGVDGVLGFLRGAEGS